MRVALLVIVQEHRDPAIVHPLDSNRDCVRVLQQATTMHPSFSEDVIPDTIKPILIAEQQVWCKRRSVPLPKDHVESYP